MKKQKGYKPPSFLRQLIDLHIERQKTRKALRILSQQEWSVDFLTAMLIRSANLAHRPLEMTIYSKNGTAIKINTIDTPTSSVFTDDSIFNHLDNELKMKQFIEGVNKR